MFKEANLPLTVEDIAFLENIIQNSQDPGVRQLTLELFTYLRTKKANQLLFSGTNWELKPIHVTRPSNASAEENAAASKIQAICRMYDIKTAYSLYKANIHGLRFPRADTKKHARKLGLD